MQFMQTIPADTPRKHAFIGVGASEGTVEVPCFAALFAASVLLRAANISVTLCIEAGNCHVDDMRNSIVASFMDSEADELIFIDEDVGFLAEDLLKLVMHDRDVVGGVYPKKEDAPNFPVFVEPGTQLWSDESGLVEVHGLPTGFLKFKRAVIEELWNESESWIGNDGREYRQIFERVIRDGMKWSHDYAVCRKWIERGGQCFADPSFMMTHTGRKTWVGKLSDYWRELHGVDRIERSEAFVKAVYDMKAGNEPDWQALHDGWGNTAWTASPELLEALWSVAEGEVIECGSGLSTLVLACRAKTLTVLEHDPAFASHVAGMLEQFGLKADIRCKPLKDGWYDFDGASCHVLVIDGPPRDISDRTIALDRINSSVVIWDDYESGLNRPCLEVHDGEKRFAIGSYEPWQHMHR